MSSRVLGLFGIVLALGAAAAPAEVKPAIPAGYAVYQTTALNPRESGVAGVLQILQDERVTSKYRDGWGSSREPDTVLPEGDPLLKSIAGTPLRNGRLRLVGDDGQVIADEPFEVPLGKLETAFLYGGEFPTYLVTVDYGIGFGSYNGPATMLAEVRGGRLVFVQAVGDKDPIRLAETLKHGWRFVDAAKGRGKEIEEIDCHPNFDNPKWEDRSEFVVIYTTYRFDGRHWRASSRQTIGFWENEGDWPARSQFP